MLPVGRSQVDARARAKHQKQQHEMIIVITIIINAQSSSENQHHQQDETRRIHYRHQRQLFITLHVARAVAVRNTPQQTWLKQNSVKQICVGTDWWSNEHAVEASKLLNGRLLVVVSYYKSLRLSLEIAKNYLLWGMGRCLLVANTTWSEPIANPLLLLLLLLL